MRWVVLGFAVALAGCACEGEKAERRYETVKRTGDAAERCRAARDVERAYLAEEHGDKYREWQVTAGLDCNQAALDAQR